MEHPGQLSVRVKRNRQKALTRLDLSFHFKNSRSSQKQNEHKCDYIQSNIFDEHLLNIEFSGKRYSIMIGQDENLKDAVFVVPCHS